MVACLGDEARYAVCWGSGDLVFLFPDVRWDKQESGFDLLMLFGACCSGPFFLVTPSRRFTLLSCRFLAVFTA